MIFVSTACLGFEEALSKRLQRYSDAGIRNIELGANVFLDMQLESIRGFDSSFLIHNYFPPPSEDFFMNLASSDREVVGKSIELVRRAIDWTSALGAPFYSVHTGFVLDPIGANEGGLIFPSDHARTELEAARLRFQEAVSICTEYAGKVGIRILIENNVCRPGLEGILLGIDKQDFLQLFSSFDQADLGMLLDVGHLSVSAKTLGYDPSEFYSALSARVGAVHLHANQGEVDEHLPFYRGSWVDEILKDCIVRRRPIIIEAKFSSAHEISTYLQWFESNVG